MENYDRGIDFAEAVTGFEFGQQRAVPIITGVVIAEENEPAVIDEWEKDEEERKIKEEGKREKTALSTWRKWLMGLRIIQRVREEYGGDADAHLKEDMNPFTNQSKTNQGPPAALEPWTLQNGEAFDPDHGDMRGGFLADDDVGGGGFLDEGHSEDDVARGTGELIIAEDDKITVEAAGPPLALSEGDGHILNPDDHDDHDDHDEGSIKQKRRLKPTLNGKGSEKSRRKISSIPASKTGLKNNRKRRASTESSVLGDGGHADPPLAPPSRKTRKARKGSAARKSEQAVRSHYFDHDSSVGGEAHKEDEG